MIPKEVERQVVARLYSDAKELDWGSVTPQGRTAQYSLWVNDPEVGGRLREFVSDSQARLWIKDGPMKEWSRALSGIGKYAEFVEESEDVPATLVRKTLGPDWEVVSSSIAVKPMRVAARCGEEEAVLTWGKARDFKHLVWAALTASVEGDARDWTLCVVETFTNPTPTNQKHAHERMARRCGLAVRHVSM